ncbi:hypothetical protein [Actinoplanes philippinensis]|uniref:hypothetical protein n=1 Tax=Actinoplanes philippinensis TaxID=35752 RepID=UPI0033FAE632
MSQHDAPDPFDGLQDWAHKTERKVRRERRRRLAARWVPTVVVGVAAVVAIGFTVPAGWALLRDSSPAAQPTPSRPDGVTATTTQTATPTDPFAGTPAASYPKGQAGITLPAARAVPGFTTAQVDTALQQVRKAMIAGRLAPGMLTDHRPDDFVALLAPSQRAPIRKWFTDRVHSNVATWIDPAVRLDPREQPRVSGRVTYAAATRDGRRMLRVTTNFVWVYAFEDTAQPFAVVHDEIQWDFFAPKNLHADDRGMWIGANRSYWAMMDCAAGDKGLLAPTRRLGAPAPGETDAPDDLLRPERSLDIHENCP